MDDESANDMDSHHPSIHPPQPLETNPNDLRQRSNHHPHPHHHQVISLSSVTDQHDFYFSHIPQERIIIHHYPCTILMVNRQFINRIFSQVLSIEMQKGKLF